ncbi:MAG: geranylgeranylglycerol-phosphate geranylgeranyltransferase [Flavobacteriales bacterium]|jgi:4-hydroxybenzoate polyprenyltransferase|nr:geranylgeranylglycerol-phosphate geranylgeranyltransferase [Flavobacteriales bacterium]MBT5089951.1 geranylgeranylglycerol-phosphate geranylgeranyltransferase [Flavobacteriales bacterium]
MSRIIYFLKLIRLKNLIIVALTQLLIKFSLINPFVDNFILSNTQFYLLVLATVFITASGYIINDIYDVETDKANKEKSRIIGKSITSRNAITWFILFNLLGVGLGFYIAYIVKRPYYSLIFIYCIFSLWTYSKSMKTSFLFGNLQVSLLTALSIFNVALFDIIPNGINKNNGEMMIFKIIIFYAAFAFIITFIREIIKDLEDMEGDKKIQARTLAITCGIEKTKRVSLIFTIFIFLGMVYFQYFQYSIANSKFEYVISIWGVNKIAIIYAILIQFLFLFLGFKIYTSKLKIDFYFISQLCKIIMIVGILSIPLFTYLHLN